jgi:hypothetical protein
VFASTGFNEWTVMIFGGGKFRSGEDAAFFPGEKQPAALRSSPNVSLLKERIRRIRSKRLQAKTMTIERGGEQFVSIRYFFITNRKPMSAPPELSAWV